MCNFHRQLLIDFYNSSKHRKPDQIIIFRYKGVISLLLKDCRYITIFFPSIKFNNLHSNLLRSIYRDGVSESQFSQVLNIELEQIIKACEFLDSEWSPKFTLIIAQKKHHTRFFQAKSPDNVPPGKQHACNLMDYFLDSYFGLHAMYI